MKPDPKIHPAVERYCNSTDPLIDILSAIPQPREAALEATVRLFNSLANPDERSRVLREVEELDEPECDPGLYLFFLTARCIVSLREDRESEARALANRAAALLPDGIPPELQALVLRLPGTIASHSGNHEAYSNCLTKAMAIVPEDSPRRRELVFSHLEMLARQGLMAGAQAELQWMEDTAHPGLRPSTDELAFVRLLDCVNAGRVAEAEALRGRVSCPKGIAGFAAAEALPTLDMMLGRWDLDQPRTPEEMRCWPEWPPVWAKATRFLWERKPREALEYARRLQGSELTWVGFVSYALIRAELACGNGEAARRIIGKKIAQGGAHYLDDFFLARAELLAGNRAAAATHLNRAARDAERYDARGRLDFELALSCELRPFDLLDLGGRAAAQAGSPELEPPLVMPVGGKPSGGEARGAARLVGQSREISAVRQQIHGFAAQEVTVLITGETGVGKELVARALHEESPRKAEPFVAVNCGAISESLLEAELFGHERGAFTGAVKARKGLFEEAGKGTLLLDEIGEIPPRLQVALLRVLETREIRPVGANRTQPVHCRVVAATNVSIEDMIAAQRFRQDLYYRLAKLEIHLPPLRERSSDILVLADLFLRQDRRDGRRPAMTADLKAALLGHRWPGNVRELRNEVERMRLLNSDGIEYGLDMLSEAIRGEAAAREGAAAPPAAAERDPAPPQEAQPEKAKAAGEGTNLPPDAAAMGQLIGAGRSQMRRLARSRDLFRKFQVLTRIELATALQVSHDTVTRDLRVLCAEDLIEKVMPTASPRTHYFRLRSS